MADLKISELAALAGANLAAGDLLPVVDVSASETKKITVTDLVGNATTLIADATIPGAKILFSAGQIAGDRIAGGGVGTTQLANDAVTAAKLGNESTVDLVTTLPGSGAFTGQLALDTDDLKVYCWDGSAWQSIKAAGSINSVAGSTAGTINIVVTQSGSDVTISATLDNTSAAAQFLAGPTANAGAVAYRTIAGDDLPTATTSSKGGVAVNGEGLRMDGTRIEIDNDLSASAGTYSVVDYNAKGLVVAGRALISSDLPAATASTKGAVIPGTGLSVNSGTLNHSNAATAGTYTKVTIDAQGHITTGTTLADTDIPSLPASKLTSGTLSVSLLGTNSITGVKLANYATVKFGGAGSTAGVVTFPTADYVGQQFFDATNGDLYLFDGNTWQPITVISGDLVYAGTYDASTNTVKSTTTQGSAAGFTANAALPAASSTNVRYYVVVSDSGTGVSPAPVVALAPPDMLVSNGATYDLVDVSNAIAGQTASNISFTPYGNLAANNVQVALQELDDEKLAKAGGTVTGELLIGTAGALAFEGSTANAYETYLAVVDPTADRTITFPDASGTVVLSGAIVNADIAAGAAIADSKLATISTAGKVSNSATTATDANTASAIVARDGSGNFSAGTITASLTGAASLNVLKAGDTLTGALGLIAGTAGAPGFFISGDSNTGIYSPGADQLAITTGGTGRMFVDSTGKVLVGTSTAIANAYAIGSALTPAVQIEGNTANGAALSITRQTSAAANLLLQRGVSGTPVADADPVGQIGFNGYDGANYFNAALIRGVVDGTPGTGSMPGRLSLQTTPSGSTTPVERLRLDSAGQIQAASLGTAGAPVLSFVADTDTGVYSPGANQLALATGGTARVSVASTGRVTVANSAVGTVTALTDGATITPDFAAANNFSVTLGGNRTLANPTNLAAGQSGTIVITQDGTGSRTLAYGSHWKFPGGTAPTLTTTASAVDVISYYVESTTRITARLISDVK